MNKHAVPLAAKLIAAAALLCAPAAASAADSGETREQFQLPARTYSAAKSEAILGGGSALAALLGKQGVQVRQADAPAPRSGYAAVSPAAAYYSDAAVDRSAHPSRPDVFGSVALEVDRTPFDARWQRVASRDVYGTAGQFARGLRGATRSAQLEMVNRYVNRRISFTEDRVQFGSADRWLAASESFSSGRGDCEDFAIAKLQMLRAAGVPDRDMYLVVLKDLVRRADHAVLVVRAEDRFRVLDNGTDRILDSADIRDYRPILTYSAGRRWTHGYQRRDDAAFPPVTLAAYQPLAQGKRVALADAMPVPASSR